MKWMLLASTGALLIYTAPLAEADDAATGRQAEQQAQQSQDLQAQKADASLEFDFQGEEISEPAGAEKKWKGSHQASFGTLKKTSDLVGMDVRSSQDENLGDIKDVMIDVKSGRIPFVVLAPDGFLRGRLVALPPSALSLDADDRHLVLNIDKQRMESAPSFERAQWPEMSNQQFSTEVYRFYSAQPYWKSSSLESQTIDEASGAAAVMSESAGASTTTTYRSYETPATGSAAEIDAEGDRVLHMYQAGKQAAIATDRRLKERGPREVIVPAPTTYKGRILKNAEAHMDERGQREIVGSYESPRTTVTERSTTYRTETHPRVTYGTTATWPAAGMMQFHRATDLMGMNIKDAQGQTVGEIKDLAIDLKSGRIAYAMLAAGGFLGIGDKWIALPATLLGSGPDQHSLVLNVDGNTLKNAPTFDRGDWEAASNQEFVSRVYSHYGQQPYWRASGSFREPAGTGLESDKQYEQQFKQDDSQVDEPSGAEKSSSELKDEDDAEESDQSDDQSTLKQDSQLNEPAGAQKSSSELESSEQLDAQKAYENENVDEPAGAQTGEVEDSKEAPEKSSDLQEPSGAETPQSSTSAYETDQSAQQSSTTSDQEQTSAPSAGLQVPSSSESSESESAQQQTESGLSPSESSAGKEASEVSEPSGAPRNEISVDKIQSQIQSDSSIADAGNVQVSSENGKVVLKGTVKSETEKQRIEQKIREMLVDNQLQVRGDTSTEQESSDEETTPEDEQD